MTSLRFLGEFGLWPSLALALALSAAAWALYRRDVAGRSPRLRVLLPSLRALAVFLATLMLAGPVLHHRRVVGQLLRLHLVVDGSQSMDLRDPQMEAGRKLMIAHQLGWTDATGLETGLLRAADRLAAARDALAAAEAGATTSPFRVFAEGAEAAGADLAALAPAALAGVVCNGTISYERWNNMPGSELGGLFERAEFKAGPAVRETRRELASRHEADEYLERFRGFLTPPASGEYTLWITGDDACELWLSASEDPVLKSLVARVPQWAPADQWEQDPAQRSRRIPLQAGRRYYLEVLHKEGGGDGHVAVRWTLPDGRIESPLPGSRLAPFLVAGQAGADPRQAFASEVVEPARRLAGRPVTDAAARTEFLALQRSAEVWEREFREAFARGAERLAAEGSAAVRAVLDRFDRTTRWERLVAALWGGRAPLLGEWARDHDVELSVLQGDRLVSLWRPRAGAQEAGVEAPAALASRPAAGLTDLAAALAGAQGAGAAAAGEADRTPGEAYVLFSDGAHNAPRSPVSAARTAGARNVPVYTVAVGTTREPPDAAITGLSAPASAFHKDHLRGRIFLNDRLPAGRPLPLRICWGEHVVWTNELKTTGEGARVVDFDFPLEAPVRAATTPRPEGVLQAGVRLDLRAEVVPGAGDTEAANNARAFEVFAVVREYRVLLVEGRPRWEWRYLDNLFSRDRKWKVTSVVVGEEPLKRGAGEHEFPADRAALFAYDLVVLGDLPFESFRPDEREWLRDFVGERGGGLLLMDGARGGLRSAAVGVLDALRPGDGLPGSAPLAPTALRVASAAEGLPALDLGPASAGAKSAWSELAAPHQLVRLKPRAGAETLLEAVLADGSTAPALLYRRFGAGQVLHLAFDETWRWRHRVGELHHARFWNQVAAWLMEAPYAARDARVSLDAGAPVYRPGQRAPLRVRLRDREGRAQGGAVLLAQLYRDGQRVAALPLAPDEAGDGGYRAETGPLEPGRHEVRVTIGGEPEDAVKATVDFVVREQDAGELARLTADESTLRQVAAAARGSFHREEDMAALRDALKPLSRGRVVESETVLWQEWPWFAAILGLVTLEWLLRKKEGML